MNPTLIELRRKPHTSISALRTYLACPRRYRLSYVDRVRPDFHSASLSLGSAWHEALAVWLAGTADDAELVEVLRERIRARLREVDVPVLFDDEDETEEAFVERAIAMLDAFRTVVPRPLSVVGSEIAFQTEVTHPSTGEVLPLPVIGAMDAVVEDHDHHAVLLEFKTSKRRWSSEQLAGDMQATLYRKAARELGFGAVRLRYLVATKAKAPQVQVLDVERTDADEAELAELFFDVHRAVQAGVDYRQRGWACASCPYASSCRP